MYFQDVTQVGAGNGENLGENGEVKTVDEKQDEVEASENEFNLLPSHIVKSDLAEEKVVEVETDDVTEEKGNEEIIEEELEEVIEEEVEEPVDEIGEVSRDVEDRAVQTENTSQKQDGSFHHNGYNFTTFKSHALKDLCPIINLLFCNSL